MKKKVSVDSFCVDIRYVCGVFLTPDVATYEPFLICNFGLLLFRLQLARYNKRVADTGVGEVKTSRATDVSEELAK